MAQLIATNQLTLTNVNDGQSIKDNLFSASNFALAKYAHPSQPTGLVSWKYNGKPNTKYTLSTDVPKNVQGTYDLFFGIYPSTPSSASNGVAINVPRTITTDATGVIEITARKGTTADSIIAKTNRVKLEENDMMTAFIFHPDDQIGDKGADGVAGKDGKGITNTVITYGISANETTQPATWIASVPTLVKGQYLWTKTVWTYTDNTNETGYTKTYIGQDGNNGTNGIAGKDGVGISSTSITYARSTSGTSAPSTGWTSSVPTVPAGEFLWTKTVWTYTDNTNETGYSVALMGASGPQGLQGIQGIQGIPGVKGADGKTQYTHIAYADNATGGGFSQTDQSKAYIGMYQDFIATDSTNPVSYKWTKWKGTDGAQGIPGPKGADGQTPYIHFAYSDNADGTGLTTSDNGQRYVGHYSDYTQADSMDKTKYRWADRWAKIVVGGRNLAQKTSADWSTPYTNFSGVANTAFNLYKVLIDDFAVGDTLKSRIVLKYTNIVPASGRTAGIMLQGRGNVTGWSAGYYNRSPAKTISGSGEIAFEFEFTITADHLKNSYWDLQFRADYIASGSLQWKLAKVEKSTVFTGWTPAQEDVQANIDTKAEQGLTQEQINALNEKNQILETEMQAKASMEAFGELEKAYHAFVAKNEKDSAQSEQDLIEASRRIELLTTQFGGLKELKTFIDTYMSSSNEGLIIGKNDASSTIKVSSDRISMFSAGKEVMYISQGVINIDNGIFTTSVQIGKFRTEQYELNADMNVIRFVG